MKNTVNTLLNTGNKTFETTWVRLELILEVIKGRPIIFIIDETGDKKKGISTDYVKRQYVENLRKVENGIVVVTAYGVFCEMTFPQILGREISDVLISITILI